MGEGHGLGGLGVGIDGHQRVQVTLGQGSHSGAQGQQIGSDSQNVFPDRHPAEGLAQIVAAAGQLQIAAEIWAGLLDDQRFDAL